MKKHDRSLKRKGFHQVDPKTEGAIVTKSILKDKKGSPIWTITRGWIK